KIVFTEAFMSAPMSPDPGGGKAETRDNPDTLLREGGLPFTSPGITAGERGPGSKSGPAFYNRAMASHRDLALAVVSVLARSHRPGGVGGPPFKVLDGLASSGVRGLRMARRIARGSRVLINDVNPAAARVILDNCARLAGPPVDGDPPDDGGRPAGRFDLDGVEVTVSSRDVRALLLEERLNYIDIDPYGSPAPFFEIALGALHKGGVAGFTATDTATLCGVYPRTSLRRYGARSARSDFCHETGARILAGCAVRRAAALDVAVRPVLVQSSDHFMRVYLRKVGGATEADALLENIGHVEMDPSSGWYLTRSSAEYPHAAAAGDDGRARLPDGAARTGHRGNRTVAGPLWLGPLHDPDLVGSLTEETGSLSPGGDDAERYDRRLERMKRWLEVAREEASMPPFFYSVDRLCSVLRLSPPRMSALRGAFIAAGHRFTSSTFSPVGFRTDASYGRALEVMGEAARSPG
ncbi:MAG: hypothetical protein KAJ19_17725, partial [Gammaproteobacteria bacterium]|nr:hypothetical protein [Gammaproteobacteria bacterium]